MPTLVRYWCSSLKSERHALRIVSYFAAAAAAGWRNYLVCSGAPADPALNTPIERLGVQIVYHPRARGNFDAAAAAGARALLRRVRCDVMHCDNTHLPPLMGAWLAGVPVRLWSKRSMEPAFEAGRPETLRDRAAIALRLSCLLATRILPVSGAVGDELVRKGIPRRKIEVMFSPVQNDPGPRPPRAEARRSLGLEPEHVAIVSVGRAAEVKGWDVLLDAFGRIAPRVPNARLVLAGDAESDRDFRARLDDLIVRHNLSHRVCFTGHRPVIAPILAAADLFVLPSRSEGHALALVEALQAGLPAVASRAGGSPEIIQPGVNGLLFEREDAAGLAERLLQLLDDDDLRHRLAAHAAASSARIMPTPEEHSAALLELYSKLLSSTKRGR
jgi:glycosyltransferase involved in cell wall biosynthesis